MPRVLIATIGSLGDLNPMLAIGEQLRALDVDVVFAAPACHERACRRSAFPFVPIGSTTDYVTSLQYSRSTLDGDGIEQFLERLNFTELEELFAQLLAASEGVDALVAPVHLVPAHLVAEKRAIPYIACALSLAHLRPPGKPGTEAQRRFAPALNRWQSTLRRVRLSQGLRRRAVPFSSLLNDAAKVLGVLPPFLLTESDHRTPNFEVVGYAEHDQPDWMVQDAQLLRFCDEQTVAFSFGSFADACDPMHFLEESVAACRRLERKCVYLSQQLPPSSLGTKYTGRVLVRSDVAPAAVFPLVGTVVQHCGTGTLVAACKSLKPMVTVPFFLDQPQQAAQLESVIGAPVVAAKHYDRETAFYALHRAWEMREPMRERLRVLMSDYRDGARPGARSILGAIHANRQPVAMA